MKYGNAWNSERLMNSKIKFKVGERVACYEPGDRLVGTIKKITTSDLCLVEIHGETIDVEREFNYKRLRKLKKKFRRRVWVQFNYRLAAPLGWLHPSYDNDPMLPDCVEFIEVKKK